MDLTDSLPEPDLYPFQLRTISIGKVLKEISLLRSDCSTGVDQVPDKYVKQVGDFLTGPLAHIINAYVSLICSFHASGKLQASHPSLIKSTIRQNRTQTIYRSLYFPRSPRSWSVWCWSKSSTILMNNRYYSQASRASGKDSPPQLFCSVFGKILFGPWRGVRSPWWSWSTIRRHLIP